HDRDELGVMIVPVGPAGATGEVVEDPELLGAIRERLAALAAGATGSSTRIGRALVMAEPPSLPDGEMTAKGNLNIRKVLTRRADLVDLLYKGGSAVVEV
ncbi:feruloyl-CoA synthetase, partial [Pseudooceanicola sp. HF7]|nr:feruloyl-CoA synthetase [Pseudooceanicola sp. HF7]